ncbi:hypothetical protein [Streptomyces cucumeris]|uniref:8-oxoguanine DNA glycosylase OGG fold protein n=1 Tax=Streptomyces cucumeris TaxID=2962890 RepID=UPI003D7453FF
MDRQARADAVDREMATRLLPEAELAALGNWWAENKATYPEANPGPHAICYTPARWSRIAPWPKEGLVSRSVTGDAWVSRADVASMVADALQRGAHKEALVATYVWGKGKRGSRKGSGPATLAAILKAVEKNPTALADAVEALRERGAQEAYASLRKAISGFGPAFFTKFLYFVGKAGVVAAGPDPLILDGVLACRMRSLATAVGRETGLDPDGSIAAWVWAEGDWTPHRYGVYLAFMHAASRQLARTDTWPTDAGPDLLECALFQRCRASRH